MTVVVVVVFVVVIIIVIIIVIVVFFFFFFYKNKACYTVLVQRFSLAMTRILSGLLLVFSRLQ
jgi:hypothetical protein